jgi:aminoglycoside phosphotransferase
VSADATSVEAMALPELIRRTIGDASITRVDHGCNAGRVFRVEQPGGAICYLKIHPVDAIISLRREADVIEWLSSHVRVPRVLRYDVIEDLAYLQLSALPGRTLIDPAVDSDSMRVARLLAKALRGLHAIDVDSCPFTRSADALSREAAGKVGVREIARWSSDHDVVFVHGDACLPNILIDESGEVGFVDLARGGVGDRYLDLTCAAHTLRYNEHPEEAVAAFFDAYDVKRFDADKLRFYTQLNKLI